MGLPIFITPVEPEVASKATEKVVAGPRSSIRRQRTIRGGSQARTSENRRRRIHDLLDSESREIQHNALSNGADTSSIASLQARANRLFENERAFNERTALSDPLSWERGRVPDAIPGYHDQSFLPPAPDPELETHARIFREREIERLHQVRRDLRRMGRRRPAPTPPYTETDIAFIARRERDSPRPSSLTPALSPARLSPPEGDADGPAAPVTAEISAMLRAPRYREIQDEHNQSSLLDPADRAERVQAFNRASSSSNMGRSRSSFRQFLRQSRLDGLGDRDRSLSPEGGAAWDTLLTSITPDPQPPSAGSSFASSSAAAAASSSNSAPTWVSAAGTTMTSPERSGESAALRDCDEASSSDSSTEDDDEELEDLNNNIRSTHREERYWRSSYADVARGPGDAQSPDMELGGMQRIISRLAERDDIPNSWWASVGLRREPSA